MVDIMTNSNLFGFYKTITLSLLAIFSQIRPKTNIFLMQLRNPQELGADIFVC